MTQAIPQKSFGIGVWPMTPREPIPIRWPTRAVAFLLVGYMFFDKAFAYLHVPGTPIFVGETVMAFVVMYLLVSRPDTGVARTAPGLMLMLFVFYSAARTIPYIPEFGLDALRDAAIWYYSVFAIFAVAAVKYWGIDRVFHWYGRLQLPFMVWAPFALFLTAVMSGPFVPDSTTSIFEHSDANLSVMIVGALVFFWMVEEPADSVRLLRRAILTGGASLIVVVSGISNRGGLVAAVAGLTTAVILARRASQRRFISIMGITLVTAIAVAGFLDLKADIFPNRREVSVRQLIENVLSVTGRGEGVVQEELGGTASWRLTFWEAIVEDVSSNYLLGGLGYGENIADRYGYVGDAIGFRSAHNSHMSIFGRSGFIGITLWGVMWWAWAHGLLRARRRFIARREGRLADICAWLMAVSVALAVNAFFDPTFETPNVAIWMWSIFGVGIAVIQLARSRPRPLMGQEALVR